MDAACADFASASEPSSAQTPFAIRNAAHALGHPAYLPYSILLQIIHHHLAAQISRQIRPGHLCLRSVLLPFFSPYDPYHFLKFQIQQGYPFLSMHIYCKEFCQSVKGDTVSPVIQVDMLRILHNQHFLWFQGSLISCVTEKPGMCPVSHHEQNRTG